MTISKSKNAKAIIIMGLILIAVVTVWVVKNTLTEDNAQGTGNPDFMLEVSEVIDLNHLKSYGVPIILDFGSDSCQPCKDMAPALKALNEELQGKAIIRFVDVWKYPKLADGFPISVIPTQIFIDASGNPYVPKDSAAIPMKMYESKETGDHIFTTHEGGLTKSEITAILKEMGMK